MENQESLKTSALVSELQHKLISTVVLTKSIQTNRVGSTYLADTIKAQIDDLFSNGIMTPGVVICSIFFTSDELFRMEQVVICSGSDFINNSWFQVDKDSTWNMFPSSSFGKECIKRVISRSDRRIIGHVTIGLDAVFKAIQLPAGVS